MRKWLISVVDLWYGRLVYFTGPAYRRSLNVSSLFALQEHATVSKVTVIF